jgi:hypothetical protein
VRALAFADSMDASVRLRSLEVEVPLAAAHAKVEFPPLPDDDAELPDPPPAP